MSFVVAAPEMMTSAASDLATIGSNVNAAHMVAAARTVAVVPAAADEVSTGIAHLFSQHAASYQSLAGQAAAFQGQFVQHLAAGAVSYANTEAFNVTISGQPPLDFLASLPPWIITGVTTLPTPLALVFLLALPVTIPVGFLLDVYLLYNPYTISIPY